MRDRPHFGMYRGLIIIIIIIINYNDEEGEFESWISPLELPRGTR